MSADALALGQPDWLYHHLRVTGAPEELVGFRAAAAGAGVIPWQEDLAAAAEDWLHLLVAPPAPQRRSLSLEGARLLAGQLQDAATTRQRSIAERAPASRACKLDLHRLLPVPPEMLRLGPGHPAARGWLWQHWGTTWPLRGVVTLPIRARAPDPGLLWLGFWSADWSPWPALLALRARWPALSFALKPLYDDP